MRTAFMGLMVTTGMAGAGVALAQSDVSTSGEPGCLLAKATPTPTPSPTPRPSGGGVSPKAKLYGRKSGSDDGGNYATSGNKKWGDIVLKRGAGAADCPKGE